MTAFASVPGPRTRVTHACRDVPPAIVLCGGLEWQVILDAPHRAAPAYKSLYRYTRIDTLDDDILRPALRSSANIIKHHLVGITSGHAGNRRGAVSLVEINHTSHICIGGWSEAIEYECISLIPVLVLESRHYRQRHGLSKV